MLRRIALLSVAAVAVAVALPRMTMAEDTVTFGFAIAQSGWMNAYDGPPLNGSMMAIEEYNAKGGILGKQIKSVVAVFRAEGHGVVVAQVRDALDPEIAVHGVAADDRRLDARGADLADGRRRTRHVGADHHDVGLAVLGRRVLVASDLRGD